MVISPSSTCHNPYMFPSHPSHNPSLCLPCSSHIPLPTPPHTHPTPESQGNHTEQMGVCILSSRLWIPKPVHKIWRYLHLLTLLLRGIITFCSLFVYVFIMCTPMFVHTCVSMQGYAHVHGPQMLRWELVFSFHSVGSGDQTQVY